MPRPAVDSAQSQSLRNRRGGQRLFQIHFVREDDDRFAGQFGALQDFAQSFARLIEVCRVGGVDDERDSLNLFGSVYSLIGLIVRGLTYLRVWTAICFFKANFKFEI